METARSKMDMDYLCCFAKSRWAINMSEEIQQYRNELAAFYRDLRSDNPALARLLYIRMKEAVDKTARWFWNQHGPELFK